ncbi:MAG: NUDIX domain-containing protein [Ruminococcus sp.]|nr:NUDIX domain-containing protein [Ruminococcus sp.]
MRYRYCPMCGSELGEQLAGDEGMVPYCEKCKKLWFDTFSCCSIVLVADEFDEIALLRQDYMSDKYSTFVSGYIKPGETAEETAYREVREEIGVELLSLESCGTFWFEKLGLLMHGFIGRAKKCELILSSEVDDAQWTKPEDVIKTIFPDSPGNAAFALYRIYMERLGKKI